MIFDLNGRKNKSLNRLIDGDNLTKINDGSSEDAFVLPYRSMVVLPSVYGNMKFRVYEYFGSGGTFTVKLYNSSKVLLGTYSKAKSAFDTWQENNPATVSSDPLNGLTMEQHTTVRFVEVSLPTATDLNIGDYEFELYGDVTGSASSIYPGTTVTPRTDPGKSAHGINVIDDRVQEYLTGSPSTYLIPLMAGSVRIGFEGMRWDIYPGSYDNALGGYFDLGRFGNNHIKTRVFDFCGPRNIDVQFYHGGGSIKNLSGAEAATSNGEYHAEVNDFRYTEVGADPEVESSWGGKAELIYALLAIYGNNTSASLSGKTITGGTTTAGQGGLAEAEVGNELNRDWAGTNPYHTPLAYYLLLKSCYDRAQDAGTNVLVLAPAVTFMDITYWRAVYFWHFWLNDASTPFPIDGFNMNLYMNSDLDGQSQSGSSTGVSPEFWGLRTRLQDLKDEVYDICFPNAKLYFSEFGFGTDTSSGYDVPAIGSKTARQVSADLALRSKAIAQSANDLVEKMHYYAFFRDGSGNFDSMAATDYAPFTPSYNGNTVYPVGYCLANELFVEQNYNWFADLITDGGTTGAWITVKNHPTDPLKKLFKIWRGTMNGSTSAETVPVGPNAISATLYTLDYADFEPTTSAPAIVGEGVDVDATEGMQWLEVTYEEAAGNQDPVSAAGADQSIQLPTNQVTVDGGGSSDPDGTIFSYAWSKISGPSTFTITSPSTAITTITDLVEGTYVFRLTVTDNDSATDTDDITITVNPAPVSNRRRWFRGSLRNKFRRG